MLFMDVLRKKAIANPHADSSLVRALNALDLTLFGIGAIIGAGVFVLTGIAAATKAGPAVVISYIIAGMASMFAALAYAELASSIGGTGSAYSYAYTGFGELFAWIIGWDLLLEYLMSVSTVAIGWSGYVANLFTSLHIYIPEGLTKTPFDGGIINIFAVFIIVMLTLLLCVGVKASARFNTVIVFIKLLTVGIFILVASQHIDFNNWNNFMPFGWTGVMQGAALVFFAYIGFDALSTAVEETVNPTRNVPIGIVASLIVCTFIYIVVSALLTLIVPYTTLNVSSPVANALLSLGHHLAAAVIAAGAVAGLTTVMLVMYFGLTRICLAIARDGLLPRYFALIHTQTRTPVRIILICGIIMSFISGFAPIDRAAELVNIGTLAAFTFVCAGVIVLRHTHADLKRPFRLPMHPVIPVLGIISCMYLMLQLPSITWWRFIIWMLFGFIVYFSFGRYHSILRKNQ